MKDGKFNASLSAQAASLKKTMQNRDRRRNSDRDISFKNVAEEQQHLAGPIHRKAVARQQADQEQSMRVSKGRSAAQSAVAAAQWHAPAVRKDTSNSTMETSRQVSTGLDAMPVFSDATHQLPQQRQHDKQLRQHVHDKQQQSNMHGKQQPQQQQQQQQHKAAAAAAPISTHADVLARLRKDNEPLTVGGWVPPILSNLQPVNGEVCNKEAQAEPQHAEAQVNLTAAVSNPEATLERVGEPSAQHGVSGLLSYESDSDESADAGSSSPSPQEGTSTLGPFF